MRKMEREKRSKPKTEEGEAGVLVGGDVDVDVVVMVCGAGTHL